MHHPGPRPCGFQHLDHPRRRHVGDTDHFARDAGRVGHRAHQVEHVGTPSSRRRRRRPERGWKRGAKQNPMPACRRIPHTLGVSSIATPSVLQHIGRAALDDAARAPCLHTGAPAPATTMAAIVDTLIECDVAPRADNVDAGRARPRRAPHWRAASTASRRPANSSTSRPWPATRRRTDELRRVASPARISLIAARAWTAVR